MPETITETPVEISMADLIQLCTDIVQTVGGQKFKVNPSTTAAQVKTADGLDVETRLATLERAASGAAVVRFADTIADRDAMTGLRPGDIVIVTDATADPTVEIGGARYVSLPDSKGFRKMSEDESMDVVCSWDHIRNKPASTPESIDLAVAKQHAHANYETIAHLSDDGAGNLLFKGSRVSDGKVWICSVDSIANTPANLADGGLVFVSTQAAGSGGSAGTDEAGQQAQA